MPSYREMNPPRANFQNRFGRFPNVNNMRNMGAGDNFIQNPFFFWRWWHFLRNQCFVEIFSISNSSTVARVYLCHHVFVLRLFVVWFLLFVVAKSLCSVCWWSIEDELPIVFLIYFVFIWWYSKRLLCYFLKEIY